MLGTASRSPSLVGKKRIKNAEGKALSKNNAPETSTQESPTKNGTNGITYMHCVRLFFVSFPEAVLHFFPQRGPFFGLLSLGKQRKE